MTDLEKQRAEADIAKWFWQPAEGHNFRYKYAVRTLTRFYEMVTPAADTLKRNLEYLRTQEISGAISLLGKQVDLGSGWVAKDAWYQTAAGDEFAGTKQNKVRVYQTLMLASEDAADGDGPYTVEGGCQYAVDHTFYWNVAELPALPASSSGIQYTMQSVFRDNETGLFSCVIEKRERVQQDVALYETAKTIFETVQEEQHLGVKAADVQTTGQAASAADGILVKRQLRKNPDCTTDVINEVTEEDPVSGAVKQYRKTLRGTVETKTDRNQESPLTGTGLAVGETRRSEKTPGGRYNNTTETVTGEGAGEVAKDCQKTVFEHTDETVTNQIAEPTDKEASAAGSGKTYRKTTRKTEEGTFDVTERTTEEISDTDSVKQYRKTLRGMVVSTTDRNQENPVGTDGIADGETRRSEKTPGGKFNNTHEHAIAADGDVPIARSCQGSSKVHTDTDVKSVPVGEEEEEHVQREVNKEKEVSYRKNEDGVTKDKTTVVREHEPRWAEIEWTGNGGTYKYVSFSHQPEKPTVETPENVTASATISQNTEGSYDGTITTFTPKRGGGGSPGEVLEQTYKEYHYEEEVLPGGRRRRRTITLDITVGFASRSTAMVRMSESKSYKGFRGSYHSIGSKNGEWKTINSIEFGDWEYVQ